MIAVFLQSEIGCFCVTDAQAAALSGRLASIAKEGPVPAVCVCRSEAEFLAALPETRAAVVWTFRQEWFALAPKLRAIFTPAAGKDYFKIAPPAGVSLHYGAFHGAIMGETALACVLALSHGILPFAGVMSAGAAGAPADTWPRTRMDASSRRIAGSTILVLGFGSIGRRFAEMAAPFGPRIIGVTRRPHPELAARFPGVRLATTGELDALLPSADHVVCFLPSGAETDNILDARRLSLMKPTAFLCNFGRGNAIDEGALAEALASGRLGGAVLDVFGTEPLPPDSPLRHAPNCWLYPHSSAFSPDYLDLYFESVAEELAASARENGPNAHTRSLLIGNGPRRGTARPPRSKSHLHRLMIADFLGGGSAWQAESPGESDDIRATRRCLAALAEGGEAPVLDCGESGSTLRFLRPVAAALGKHPHFVMRGRLSQRPGIEYGTLEPGLFRLPGDVSSQFATGLLFALPLLGGDSEIEFTTPPESLGYVEMTLDVLAAAGVEIARTERGYRVPGSQRYRLPAGIEAETDWSGAAFWLSMNRLGSEVLVEGLDRSSHQPDRAVEALLAQRGGEKDMAQCPDLFPALAAVAGAEDAVTAFTSIRRLRMKESDRVAAMAAMLTALGAKTEESGDRFTVHGLGRRYAGGCAVRTFSDHRIAMAAAVAASAADAPIEIDDGACVAKSYPGFFSEYAALEKWESGRVGE